MNELTELDSKKSDVDDSTLDHIFCDCNPNIALCGTDISTLDFNTVIEEDLCVVCKDLEDKSCDRCGS